MQGGLGWAFSHPGDFGSWGHVSPAGWGGHWTAQRISSQWDFPALQRDLRSNLLCSNVGREDNKAMGSNSKWNATQWYIPNFFLCISQIFGWTHCLLATEPVQRRYLYNTFLCYILSISEEVMPCLQNKESSTNIWLTHLILVLLTTLCLAVLLLTYRFCVFWFK